ncbi:S8 family peptidase [Desertivirga xinjiangensis]|uniref:S8 family peptidase n=1 Tax=Desertivirga xinjiangensis TaxID=539206 RepID=UPI00210C834E|nr:S8 family peptidase [Pedobacter xinjiangensis]
MTFFRKIFFISLLLPLGVMAQDQPKPNWQNLDLQKDGVFGISTEKAYDLLKGRESSPVIVAVIDGGIDEDHEDLKSIMWKNPKEVAGNKVDEDKNGYTDDIYGWNFIGSAKGNVRYDNLELVRLIRIYQDKYASVLNSTPLSAQERKEFSLYKKLVTEHMDKMQNARIGYENFSIVKKTLDSIVLKIGKKEVTATDIEKYDAKNGNEQKVLKLVKSELKKEQDFKKVREELNDVYKYYYSQLNYHLNLMYDPRDSIGDDYADSRQRLYGNGDVTGPDAYHGTHVAGIIGAVRNNSKGINGVADNVRIMGLRAVPDGDERDKDIANSIRYAVDNGARVINMSFGKGYSWDKAVVDSAVRYAEQKDVLIVHAAGNDGKNNDHSNNFPNKFLSDTTNANFANLPQSRPDPFMNGQNRQQSNGIGGIMRPALPQKPRIDSARFFGPQVNNWIEVGASGWKNDENLVAEFSNYGRYTVDVFAPGMKISSTIPESKYKEEDGTSMASPVVAGLAALIRSYYPNLTAAQVKDIILKSVVKVEQKVKIREDGERKKVKLADICISGGVVNAYNALQMASKVSASL